MNLNANTKTKILRNELAIVGIQHVRIIKLSGKVREIVIYDLFSEILLSESLVLDLQNQLI